MALCVESALSIARRARISMTAAGVRLVIRGQDPYTPVSRQRGRPMPREDRRIIFDYAETYKAIFALCVKKEMPRLFVGGIAAIAFKANDDKIVVVRFANELQGTAATSEYSQDFLAAALVLYCRTCAIPVPKRGRKSVELGADIVTLHIVL
jgi:hypothetical protein